MHNETLLPLPELHYPFSGFSPVLLGYCSASGDKSPLYFALATLLSFSCPPLMMGTVSLDFEGLKETLWKNSTNFVKDVCMIYINFIIIVVIVSEKKIGGITLLLPLVSLLFLKFFEPYRCFTLQVDCDVCDGLLVTVNHKH
jgi:hypothetical protein